MRMNDSLSDSLTFEQALAALEQIVRQLEDGQTSLEDALTRYETGVGLVKRCYNQLARAEQRILLLMGQDGDGKPVLRPFNHAATAEPEKAAKRPEKAPAPEQLF
jgi:exodeoxyribonuclease VII small subunit